VKWVEAGGGRVIPLHYNDTATLAKLAANLNGILFTGGGADISKGTALHAAGRTLYDIAVKRNNAGDFVALWGVCMGFQFMSVLEADNDAVLEGGFDSYNYPIPLNFSRLAATSRLFSDASSSLITGFATQNITMNNHHFGVTSATYHSNARLSALYNVLSNNVDRNGREFVSTVEAKKYPFYGLQWHPEKNPWEWTVAENIPHSAIAVEATLYTSQFFINEARKSTSSFDEATLNTLLIYNTNPVFTGKAGDDFVQRYIW